MARYQILMLNFSKKTFHKYRKLLGDNFDFLELQDINPDQKIHLTLVYWKSGEICQDIQNLRLDKVTNKTPIYLIAPLNESLLLQCFQNGIDDFINTDWSSELIKAKLLAFFKCRKKFKKDHSKKIRIGNVTINPKKRKVTRKGFEVPLTKIEYDILNLLANDSGKIFSRDEIYGQIWGRHVIVGERTLDVHMNNLRKKIGKSKIRTKKGIGFSINPDL